MRTSGIKIKEIFITKLILIILFFPILNTADHIYASNDPVETDAVISSDEILNWENLSKFEAYIKQLYNDCGLKNKLNFHVFRLGVIGFLNIRNYLSNKKEILTIIDYSQHSLNKRFFVIDIKRRKLLYYLRVAHADNSGYAYAVSFSNETRSRKNSLGLFVTAETYKGRHGYSLRIDGLEEGFNNNARNRAVVVHGADYVCDVYLKDNRIPGRSGGCPAIPMEISREVIDVIKAGTCLFIYHNNKEYLSNSKFLDAGKAMNKYIRLGYKL
jgi:hypothetical protein